MLGFIDSVLNMIFLISLIMFITFGIIFIVKLKRKRGVNTVKKIFLISLSVMIFSFLFGSKTDSMVDQKHQAESQKAKVIKENHYKLLNKDETYSNDFADNNGYSLDSNNQGKATYKFSSNNGSYIKILKGIGAKVKRISRTRINVDMYVSENKDNEEVTAGVYNKNGKLLKKIYLEITNQRDSYVNKEVKDDKTTKSASEIKKDNEKKNLASYKQDLNTIPDKIKGVISKAYVDENGSEQTTVVLSDEALNVSDSELKNISHKIYNYMSNFISNYTPFPDDSLADSIRIIDSSGNLIAKTSWGEYKYVGNN